MKTLFTSIFLLLAFCGFCQNKTYRFYYDKVIKDNADLKFRLLLEYSNNKSSFRSLNENRGRINGIVTIKTEAFSSVNGKMVLETDTSITKKLETKSKQIKDSLNKETALKTPTQLFYNNKPSVLKDLENKTYFFKLNLKFYKDTNYVTAPLENFNWVLINETKKIANKTCKKATCTWMDRNYTAWYCPSIPISGGPYKFTGLPGIILEIYDDEAFSHYVCTAIETENISTTITLPTETTDLITMKKNANKALLKIEELNRSRNQVNNNSVFGNMEYSLFTIELVERSWLKNKFKD